MTRVMPDEEGHVIVRDREGAEAFHLDGGNATLTIGGAYNQGNIRVRDAHGRETIQMDGSGASLYVGAHTHGAAGHIRVRDLRGLDVFHMNGPDTNLYLGAAGNEGDVYVRNGNGDDTIHLNGSSGNVILFNADAAEDFDLAALAEAVPGTAMVLAGDGTVQPCTTAYARKVAPLSMPRSLTRRFGPRLPSGAEDRIFASNGEPSGGLYVADLGIHVSLVRVPSLAAVEESHDPHPARAA
jgi:hypothetical protein